MTGTQLGLAGIAICVVCLVFFQIRARKQTHRPLASFRPDIPQEARETALGLEAIDMDAIDDVNRRNDALSSMTGSRHSQSSYTRILGQVWKPKPTKHK